MDNILFAVEDGNLPQRILQEFNSWDESLKFTLELQLDNKINFLDTTIIHELGEFSTQQYKKPKNKISY